MSVTISEATALTSCVFLALMLWFSDSKYRRLLGIVILGILLILVTSCTPMHKVAHALRPCQPNQQAARAYACRTYGFCSENAGVILVGDEWTFTSNRWSNKAEWRAVEWLPREVCQ